MCSLGKRQPIPMGGSGGSPGLPSPGWPTLGCPQTLARQLVDAEYQLVFRLGMILLVGGWLLSKEGIASFKNMVSTQPPPKPAVSSYEQPCTWGQGPALPKRPCVPWIPVPGLPLPSQPQPQPQPKLRPARCLLRFPKNTAPCERSCGQELVLPPPASAGRCQHGRNEDARVFR